MEAPEGNDIRWNVAGPGGGGWIQSIAFDQRTPDILYVGCDVGGFYFSTNAGRSYELRNRGLRDYFVEAIAVHPRDSRIILLGTQSGVHLTTNQGVTWQWMRRGFPATARHRFSAPIGAICFDPLRPQVAYAGLGQPRFDKDGAGAIYRTDDTGRSWRRVDGNRLPAKAIVSDLEVQPDDSRVILAATSEGIYRSDNEGATWDESNDGLPHRYVEELAFAPASPGTVYATLRCTSRSNWNGGVFISEDAGKSWRNASGDGLPKRLHKSGGERSLTSNPKEIVVDPNDARTAYVGNRDWVSAGVYKTTDAGRHWTRVTYHEAEKRNMDYGWITSWGPSVECLAIRPPGRVVFGTSGHVFMSDDAGKSWQQRYSAARTSGTIQGTGLEVTCVWRVISDPVRTNRIYCAYMDIGLLISEDNGRTFRQSHQGMKHQGNCFAVVVDPMAPNTLWAATGRWESNQGDVCRSDDDGHSWQVVGQTNSGLPDGQVLEMVLDPGSPVGQRRLLAACNGHGFFETSDGGKSWHSITGNLPAEEARKPRGILLDPQDPKHLIAALHRQVYGTLDGGKTWQQLNAGSELPDIQQIVADPTRFRVLYAAAREYYDSKLKRLFPGGLYRSEDAGRSWQRILDYHFVHNVAINPRRPNILYAATADHPYHDEPVAAGLLKSVDGGRTWRRENVGLSLLNLKSIAISPHQPARLYLGSSGNSLFTGEDSAIK
jgi:photosystem II stability/assembly factor-like uncharacterized protein